MTDYREPQPGDVDYSDYWAELKQGRITPTAMGDMQRGYYRLRNGGGFEGICVRGDKDHLNGLMVIHTSGPNTAYYINDAVKREQLWSWCAKRATTKTLFYVFNETGEWRDQPEKFDGSNAPADPLEALLAELADKRANAEKLLSEFKDGVCPNKEKADLAANYGTEINALLKRADKLHETEKAYWLEGSREVDGKYKFRDADKKGVIAKLQAFFRTWLVAEQRRANAAAEAERERLAAEAQKQAEHLADQYQGVHIEAEPVPEIKPQKVQIGTGGSGSPKKSLRKELKATPVDWDRALAAFGKSAEVRAALQMIANNLCKSAKGGGIFIPGFEVRNELDEVISDGINPAKKDAA